MVEMCGGNAHVFPFADASLAKDSDFLHNIVDKNMAVLQFLDHETQLLYPDLVMSCPVALGKLPKNDYETRSVVSAVAKAIDPSFWEKEEFTSKWVSAGLDKLDK